MRRILFGTLLALLLTSLGCNQRPERDVPLDTSTEPLFLGPAEPCGTDSVAGWTDCDPKTNRPTRGTTANANRVRIENTPGLRTGTPNASTSMASTKDDEASLDPADLEIGVPLWSSDLASEESESTSDDAFPAFWQSENMPAFTASSALGATDAPGGGGGGGGGGGSAAGGAGLGSFSSGGGGGGGSGAGQLSLSGGGNVPGVNTADAPTPVTVPEPSTIVLLATGLILLGFIRLRVNADRTDN